MPSKLTADDVQRVAKLAQLDLSDEEVARYAGQLARILEYAEMVQRVDTAGVPPTCALSDAPAWRDDAPRPSLDRDRVLDSAPDADRAAGLFRVPKVIG